MKRVSGTRWRFILISLSLGLVLSCHKPGFSQNHGEGNKINFPGYLYERDLNEKKTWLAFFRSWTGYGHPIALEGAVSYGEAQQLGAYYCAYFQGEKGAELLVRVDKVILTRQPYLAMIGEALRGNGLALYQALETDAGYELGRTIALDDTIDLTHYLEVDLLPESPPSEVRLVSKEIDYSFRYAYDAKGALTEAVIIAGGKVKTINYSNGR